jgi:hypothetical protein
LNTDTEILLGIIIFLAVLGFISSYLPVTMQILNNFDFIFLSGSIIGVTGACVIITGIPCAVALAVFAFGNLILYFIMPNTFIFIKPIIIVPITLIITYIISRLARGGG